MSTYTTRKVAADIGEINEYIMRISPSAKPSDFLRNLCWLAHTFMRSDYCHLAYFAPEVVSMLIYRLSQPENLLESARAELSAEEFADLEAEVRDAYATTSYIEVPENSFFFAYKDGEYFSVKVNAAGELVEDYKYDQLMTDGQVFPTLREWYQAYGLSISQLEAAVCVDYLEHYYD